MNFSSPLSENPELHLGDHCKVTNNNALQNSLEFIAGVAIACFVAGSIFGAITTNLLKNYRRRRSSTLPDYTIEDRGPGYPQSPRRLVRRAHRVSGVSDAGDCGDPMQRDMKPRRRRRVNSFSDDGRLFANCIRKFSLLNEFQHGLIEARGTGLEIVSIDPIMHKLLGWPVGNQPQSSEAEALPTSVHDLLPAEFRQTHRKFLTKAAIEGELPSSLMHPLRNVQMVRLDGTIVHVDVCIGVITKDLPLDSENCMFYALVSERPSGSRSSSPTRAVEQETLPESIASLAQALYGHNVGLSVARGVLPRPEDYAKATVLFLDVVDFTKTCMELSCSEVALWMSNVHMAIEELIKKHAIRKIETRGDCYIVISGCNSVEGDLSGTQMERMMCFAKDVARSLFHSHNGTKVRFGVASGAMTVAYIATHRFAPTMVACGDTVNTAARMEQCGYPGLVHMTAEAAAQLYKEGPPASVPPPLHLTNIKSKGTMLTAWYGLGCGYGLNYSTVTGNAEGFLTEPPPEVPPRDVVRRRRSHTDVEIRLANSGSGGESNSGVDGRGGGGSVNRVGSVSRVSSGSGAGSGSDSGYGNASSGCGGLEAAGRWNSWRSCKTRSDERKSRIPGDGDIQKRQPASSTAVRRKSAEGA